MFHFGFSPVGLVYLLMLFIPNLMWTKKKPENYDDYARNENRFLVILERTGEALVCACALIFADFEPRPTVWVIWLILSFLLMLLYEVFWIRYFNSPRTMKDFYSSLIGIPVAGATLPVCAFFLLAVYGCNVFLMVSTLILGVGHIGIHWNHRREILGPKPGRF